MVCSLRNPDSTQVSQISTTSVPEQECSVPEQECSAPDSAQIPQVPQTSTSAPAQPHNLCPRSAVCPSVLSPTISLYQPNYIISDGSFEKENRKMIIKFHDTSFRICCCREMNTLQLTSAGLTVVPITVCCRTRPELDTHTAERVHSDLCVLTPTHTAGRVHSDLCVLNPTHTAERVQWDLWECVGSYSL